LRRRKRRRKVIGRNLKRKRNTRKERKVTVTVIPTERGRCVVFRVMSAQVTVIIPGKI
jgi:hypothetical protein